MKNLFSLRPVLLFSLLLLFSTALAIRAYDITDLPLDFHPSRQLFSAIKARGMFYETLPDAPAARREFAMQQAKTKVTIEPEIMEHIAVFFYRQTGREQLWIPRMIAALFWLTGGIFVYLLARDLTSTDGAMLALAFYLFVPYGIFASRSFQPDPLMVMLIVAFWWLIFRWASSSLPFKDGPGVRGSWRYAVLAGLVGGLAIFVKFVAAFFVIGGALGALLGRFRLRELFRHPQVWTMAVLGMIPGIAWILYGKFVLGLFENGMSGRFIPSLLVSPSFYLQWQVKAAAVAGGIGIMLGLLGLLLSQGSVRAFLTGIWGSYVVFGLYFNYHISTHDYYSLPLIPVVALSLAVLGERFFVNLAEAGQGWVRSAILLVLLYGIFSTVWDVRNQMKSIDYRPQEAMWIEIGETLQDHAVIALTQDYGTWLAYWGWQRATIWPSYGDLYQASARGNPKDIQSLFDEAAASKTYFLVTDMEDLKKQPELRARLDEFPIAAQGEGYLIYALQAAPEAE
ncbi:MAG: hypothetical protein Kow002_03860 [Anaerolineales bacterium]